MKAVGVFVFFDPETGEKRKVKTQVNDDYSIHAFYDDPVSVNTNVYVSKKPKKQIKLGDWVKKTIDFLTYKQVKPCNVCKQRQALLNRLTTKEKVNG
tara:strand:+ start:447 stop:737 length:291 start_codon:yes stop_codon:yes gene_type:complete